MSTYARSLAALGFDPAPGDIGLTRNLAQRHSLVAQESRQVLALVERLNLSSLQGRAADALRTIQGTFPPALRNTASDAESLQAGRSSRRRRSRPGSNGCLPSRRLPVPALDAVP